MPTTRERRRPTVAALPVSLHLDLATLLARGLVSLDADDLGESNLTLELGLTLWMSRTGAGAAAVRSSLMNLRSALLRSSDLDETTEPVPLLAGDERTTVLSLAVYVHHLLQRAAASIRVSPADAADEALVLLDG